MNNLWPLLVTGGFGILGTLSGVWLTQRASAKREAANWEREVEREKQRWMREDHARTFDERRKAYVAFYQQIEALEVHINQWIVWGDEQPQLRLQPGWEQPLLSLLDVVRIYGSEAVYASAMRAFELMEVWHNLSGPRRNDENLGGQAGGAKVRLLAAIRRDLGVKADSDPDAMKQALGAEYYDLLQNGIPSNATIENES